MALGDVNGDGRPDLVVANYWQHAAEILLGQANGTFIRQGLYATGSSGRYSPFEMNLADLNGDGRLDIITTEFDPGSAVVLLNTGTYTPLATARPTAADLSLAPNPAHDGFAVTLPAGLAPTQAELLNALGQVVRRPAVGGATSFRVETAGLAPGLYTLRVRAGSAALARCVAVE